MATTPRRAHVKRIYKLMTNSDVTDEFGDPEKALNTDYFVDVLRLDQLPVFFQSTEEGKIRLVIRYFFAWNDDILNPLDNIDASNADLQFENANAKRVMEKLRIADPDVTAADEEQPFYIWLVRNVKVKLRGKELGIRDQIVQFVFRNVPLDGSKGEPGRRTTSVLKVRNNDLNHLMDKAADDESYRIFDWDTYRQALIDGKVDDDDPFFLTVEATDNFIVKFQADELKGRLGQMIRHVLQNKPIENMTNADGDYLFFQGDKDVLDADGNTALIRTDPLQQIVNVGSNIIAVELKGYKAEYDDSRDDPDDGSKDPQDVEDGNFLNVAVKEPSTTQKFTLSSWVYISSDANERQGKIAQTLDDHIAPKSVRTRIPLWQIGSSLEPRVGIHINMGLTWEGYLGWFWWSGGLIMPSYPDYLGEFYIGGEESGNITPEGWWPFGGAGIAYPSVDPAAGWNNALVVIYGTAAANAGTAFYYMPIISLEPPYVRNIFPIIPAVYYQGFTDTGIRDFFVTNRGPLGPYFAQYPAGDFFGDFALPMSWHFSGQFRVALVADPRLAVKIDDIAKEPHLVNSEVYFTNFWASPFNNTMQPTPTLDPFGVNTGPDTSKYFAFGDIVVVFPMIEDVNYGKPAIPSTLYYDNGQFKFLITAKWPEENQHADGEIVSTLEFSASGAKLDSWNHIFFTLDLSKMRLKKGQDNKTLTQVVQTVTGPQTVHVPLAAPTLEDPPLYSFIVNGVLPDADEDNEKRKEKIVSKFTTYPKHGEKWATGSSGIGSGDTAFAMALEGGIGHPILEQDVDRWKVNGPDRNTKYAFSHIYLDKYIEPTKENLSKFFWRSKNKDFNYVIPPPDKKAAVKKFGKPGVWIYRDKQSGVEWKNQGTLGGFALTGPKPKDFRPGPGQPIRNKQQDIAALIAAE